MSVGNSEKWILVEWGNCTRGIVHSGYLVDVGNNRELQAGCSVIIGKRGEQQIATFLARSNERPLLEQLLKQSNETEQEGAGPSTRAVEEEPGDFSGSASSWAPSENDASESSDSEVEKEDEEKKLKAKHNASAQDDDTPRRRTTKKVLTPSNRVNAIIPNSMKKVAKNAKNNTKQRKRKLDVTEKENIRTQSPPMPPNRKADTEPKTLNIKVKLDDIIAMKDMFDQLFTIFRTMRGQHKTGRSGKGIVDEVPEKNATVLTANTEMDVDESRSEDLNRSDDNVLITNKYRNIINDTQEGTLNDTQNETQNDTQNETQSNIQNQTNNDDVYNIQNETIKDEWVAIGSGKTLIHRDKFRKVKWTSYTMATRGLLLAAFPRRVLATHSLTGKKSPAFMNKPAKMCLDPKKVADIVIEVMDRFNVRENLIRSIITTKCADEGKMFRTRLAKKGKLPKKEDNDDIPNIEPPAEAGVPNQ